MSASPADPVALAGYEISVEPDGAVAITFDLPPAFAPSAVTSLGRDGEGRFLVGFEGQAAALPGMTGAALDALAAAPRVTITRSYADGSVLETDVTRLR